MMAPLVRNAGKKQKKKSRSLSSGSHGSGEHNEKTHKMKSRNARFYRKLSLLGAVSFALVFIHARQSIVLHHSEIKYELLPFLIDSNVVVSSNSSSTPESLSKPTLPSFPIIPRLEGCKLNWKPPNPPRQSSEWRSMFWIPAFPGSGGPNPTKDGDLTRELIEKLFLGDSEDASRYKKPVKNFHASIKNGKLKRCVGVSETIGCSCGHPLTSTSPENQKDKFRPEVIMPIRNPATAIPEFFTDKHIAYHGGTKQDTIESWRTMRDAHFESTLQNWMDFLRYWRGTESDSYYHTQLYIPFEDIVTTDAAKGTSTVLALSSLLSGNAAAERKHDKKEGASAFFETTMSRKDCECLWYRVAKAEWHREQKVIGDYIPPYTKRQQAMMVQNLTNYAAEVEKDLEKEGFESQNSKDSFLVPLLRRYAYQIENYLHVET